ncbi:MAG TPA: DUF488 family protein [Acidobacteriota bacterium]|nr:DUF488 family protein [Acidobacteriota bacterium]
MQIRTKRIYQQASDEDGRRILVDRLWPRGISKQAARIDYWAKEIAPSNQLRRWYQHDPDKWEAFRHRYFEELDDNPHGVAELRSRMEDADTVTFLYSSKEESLNNAAALREYFENLSAG